MSTCRSLGRLNYRIEPSLDGPFPLYQSQRSFASQTCFIITTHQPLLHDQGAQPFSIRTTCLPGARTPCVFFPGHDESFSLQPSLLSLLLSHATARSRSQSCWPLATATASHLAPVATAVLEEPYTEERQPFSQGCCLTCGWLSIPAM